MELFNLLAKLTLDTNEFSRGIDQAEQEMNSIDVDDPQLGLDNDEFNSGIEESQGLGDSFGSEMEKVFNGVKSALTVTGIVAAISGIVNGLKEAVNLTAETADGIDKGSKKLGISTKAYQEWDHALKQSGSGIEAVKKGIMNFQAAMKAADPATPFADAEDQVDGLADKTAGLSQDAYEALRELGLLSRLQAGEFQNAEELMNASLLALADYVDDEHSVDDRGILVRKLFGRGGDELNALLNEGEEGVKALLSEASELGLIMSDEEIKQAVEYGDAVENLNAELDAIKTAFVRDIIPVLTTAVGWLTNFLTMLNPRLQTNSIYQIFDEIDAKTIVAGRKVDEANATAKKLIEDLQELGNYWTLDEQGRMTWDALADKALDLFPQLSDYIDTDGKKIKGNTEAIEANIDAWSRLEKQRLLSAAMDEKREAVAKQLIDAYKKGAEAAEQEAVAEGKRQVAIDEINKLLQSGQNTEFSETFKAIYGEGGVTKENADSVLEWFTTNFSNLSTVATDMAMQYSELQQQAESTRAAADDQISKAEAAQDELESYERRLSDAMGLTADNIRAARKEIDEYAKALDKLPRHVGTSIDNEPHYTHAIGSAYIPFDNYPALLHRGEKVLTATEARQTSDGIDYGHLEERIAAAIRAGMDGATVRSFINGREVTDEVNRNNMRDVKGRRFKP